MNILVTGANGQLGRSLRKISPDYPGIRFTFCDLPRVDITDREQIRRAVVQSEADLVVNCAAYTAVDKAEREPDLARRVNAYGPAILAEICRESAAGLIHISTDYVFDGCGNRPLAEDDPVSPAGVYGRTKLEGEQAVSASGCDALIVRTSWLYSEFGGNFVKTMLNLARQRRSLNVVYDQTGTPTYAADLARTIAHLARERFRGCTTLHYSNEGVTSWYDFAKSIFSLAGVGTVVNPIQTKDYPTPALRPAYSVLSKEKIKSTGVTVPYWVDSLRICLNEIKRTSL